MKQYVVVVFYKSDGRDVQKWYDVWANEAVLAAQEIVYKSRHIKNRSMISVYADGVENTKGSWPLYSHKF